MRDVVELLVADFFELLAFGFQLLIDLDDLLGHHFMGFLRAADEREVWPGGDTLLAVGIQPQPEQHCFAPGLFIFHIRHEPKLECQRSEVKGRMYNRPIQP